MKKMDRGQSDRRPNPIQDPTPDHLQAQLQQALVYLGIFQANYMAVTVTLSPDHGKQNDN